SIGHAENRRCQTMGRDNEWVLTREGVIFRVAVLLSDRAHNKPLINIAMTVPKDRTVEALFSGLRAYGPTGKRLQGSFGGNASGLSDGVPRIYRFNEDVQMLYGSRFATKQLPSTTYIFGLTLENELPSKLKVILPQM